MPGARSYYTTHYGYRDFKEDGSIQRPLLEDLEKGNVGHERRDAEQRHVNGRDLRQLHELAQMARKNPHDGTA